VAPKTGPARLAFVLGKESGYCNLFAGSGGFRRGFLTSVVLLQSIHLSTQRLWHLFIYCRQP